MTRRVLTFLLCLLMAALPLQGLAAVVKASCGAVHHNPTMQPLPPADDAHERHVHHDPAGHGTAGNAADFHHRDLQAGESNADVSEHCGSCASCSAGGAVLPGTGRAGLAESAPTLAPPASTTLLAGIVPAGLERPPKPASF